MNDDDKKQQNSDDRQKKDENDQFASQSYNEGEQSVSGTMPDPESDDDTLANAQEAGTQLDEDTEHPQELDIGSDVDKAEAHHRDN